MLLQFQNTDPILDEEVGRPGPALDWQIGSSGVTRELEGSTHLAGDPTLLNPLLFRSPELAVHILAHILLTHVLETYLKSFFSCTNVKLRKRARIA